MYNDDPDKLTHSEACVNYDVALPCIKAASNSVKEHGYNMTTFPGEEELYSMTRQLQQQGQTDKRLKYNTDGVTRFNKMDEVLILETSSAYNKATCDKASFDHYKAMFGLLSVLRTTAEKYEFASLDMFKELKIHFVHVHGM